MNLSKLRSIPRDRQSRNLSEFRVTVGHKLRQRTGFNQELVLSFEESTEINTRNIRYKAQNRHLICYNTSRIST